MILKISTAILALSLALPRITLADEPRPPRPPIPGQPVSPRPPVLMPPTPPPPPPLVTPGSNYTCQQFGRTRGVPAKRFDLKILVPAQKDVVCLMATVCKWTTPGGPTEGQPAEYKDFVACLPSNNDCLKTSLTECSVNGANQIGYDDEDASRSRINDHLSRPGPGIAQ